MPQVTVRMMWLWLTETGVWGSGWSAEDARSDARTRLSDEDVKSGYPFGFAVGGGRLLSGLHEAGRWAQWRAPQRPFVGWPAMPSEADAPEPLPRLRVVVQTHVGTEAPSWGVFTTLNWDQQLSILADYLGHHQPAIDIAMAHRRMIRRPLDDYLEQIDAVRVTLPEEIQPRELATVAAVVAVTLEDLTFRALPSVELVHVCAFFAAEPFPIAVLTEHRAVISKAVGKGEVDSLISPLADLGLLRRDGEFLLFSAEVQAVIQVILGPERERSSVAKAQRLLIAALPSLKGRDGPSLWPRYEQLLPHARALTERLVRLKGDGPPTARVLNQVAFYLECRGHRDRALALHQEALGIFTQHLGAKHPETIASLNNVGFVRLMREDYDEARSCLTQALSLRREVHGETHPSFAASLMNLGGLLEKTGDLPGALDHFHRALPILETECGDAHPRTATCYNNIGKVLCLQGQLEEAEHHLRGALEVRRSALGSEHPLTVQTRYNLGELHRQAGDLKQARRVHEEVWSVRRRVLGEEHPSTAESQQTLSDLVKEMDG